MEGAAQRDRAFFSGVCLKDQPVKTRRDNFVLFRQQKNCRRATRSRVGDAVEVSWDLQRNRPGEQPQIPPAKLAQDNFAQRHRIMQNQSGDRTLCRDVKRSGCADARAE